MRLDCPENRGGSATAAFSKATTPTIVMSIAATCAVMLSIAVIYAATSQPWLGLRLERHPSAEAIRIAHVAGGGPAAAIRPAEILHSVGGIALEPNDLVEEPDTLSSYAAYARVLARQGQLHERLLEPAVRLGLQPGGSAIETVAPAPRRPVTSLPLAFWTQMFAGASGFLIGAWVWSLRLRELSGWLMAIGGAGLLIMIFPAAIYSTRELALDPALFRWLAAIDHFGALTFGAAMVALFYVYPHRLVPPKALLALAALFGAWWLADTAWIVFDGPPLGFHLAALVLMLLFFPAAVLQYRMTRDDPVKRAALRWFALSVGLGTGAFITLIVLPNVLGRAQMLAQAPAFLLFIIVYGGVAIGVARYRLFELEGWAFGVLFYVAGALLLVALDAFLIFVLSLDRVPALGLSLIAVALLYLPLRDILARRMLPVEDRGRLFPKVVDVALTLARRDRDERWAQLLREAFNPLRLEVSRDGVPEPRIADEGLTLLLPDAGGVTPLRLGYANSGRRLFSGRDLELATELCAMLAHSLASRNAYEKGAAEERIRIARDMHDNIGAKLLSALHSGDSERKNVMIRDTLSDLRGIVNNASGDPQPLADTLSDLRAETAERLAAAGLGLAWEAEGEDAAALSTAAAHALRSVLREAVSNTIRHAGASAVRIAVGHRNGWLALTVDDDGRGMRQANDAAGNGLVSMHARLAALGGTLVISDIDPGLRLVVEFPVGSAP